MRTCLIRQYGSLPNQSVFESAESQPCRIALHVSDVRVARIGAFDLRFPNKPNQESSSACRIRNGDTTLRCTKAEQTFLTAMGRMVHSHSFSVECFGTMCSEEDGAFAQLFCGMLFE